ncbi:MAG: TIGR03905 family TSCPD domain-containing protein [Bacteroidaceae bacterium]|nr:TIGR03905 family TSCPD domain-containing protein [Bacteroidaceae bacterium]
MRISYKTHGTCSSLINLDVEDGIIRYVQFYGGCNGNLQGICRLVTGMKAEEAIARLEGIQCNHRPTSCPDQLAQALKNLLGI